MSAAKRAEQRRCVHRYLFETPHGQTVRGVCRRCGRVRRLPAQFDAVGRSLKEMML